ncbi:hypothetical protein ARTHRO9AX_180439 [Arthrobacter sp. 9AX]|nr:hypothetical protein ARTHRO9AX_180439 [Arthrobacter sp. 9AX]
MRVSEGRSLTSLKRVRERRPVKRVK